MSSRKSQEPSFGNPYAILGVSIHATDAEIKKAYRSLARGGLHPDKRAVNQSPAERAALDQRYHAVQEAHSFLIEEEFRVARTKFKTFVESEELRRKNDAKREGEMSARRKRMRDELAQKLSRASAGSTTQPSTEEDRVDQLRREGTRRREQHSSKHSKQQQQQKEKLRLESRQIRLKWSRSKIPGGHSEHSLAKMLESQFGAVQIVELIGSKGNEALVTFAHQASCRPCVETYKHSEEMRAQFVGKQQQQKTNEEERQQTAHDKFNYTPAGQNLDRESMEERTLRQFAERERISRRMDSSNYNNYSAESDTRKKPATTATTTTHSQKVGNAYPPRFPPEDEQRRSPFERLETMEILLLGQLIPPAVLANIQN